jgi:hypothetical protein
MKETQFKLRLPDDLKVRLEKAASDSGRKTVTAEIIHRLSATFEGMTFEESNALASGIAVGTLKGIAGAAPPEVGKFLDPIVERMSREARAYFEDPATSAEIYERRRREVENVRAKHSTTPKAPAPSKRKPKK